MNVLLSIKTWCFLVGFCLIMFGGGIGLFACGPGVWMKDGAGIHCQVDVGILGSLVLPAIFVGFALFIIGWFFPSGKSEDNEQIK